MKAEAGGVARCPVLLTGSAPESEFALAETKGIYRGYASIDGRIARNGTEVTAWIDGVLSGMSTVFGGKGYFGPLLVRQPVAKSFEGKGMVFVVGNLTIWTSRETYLNCRK